MTLPRIEKDIFPGLMIPPFRYACFTRFHGYSEDVSYSVHSGFQVIIGLTGAMEFEMEGYKVPINNGPGNVFVLSPGIRHRWKSGSSGFTENFMFFCDGFVGDDSDLGRVFDINQSEIVWSFDLKESDYSFYIDHFRKLIEHHNFANVNIMHGLLYAFCGMICQQASTSYPLGEYAQKHSALIKAMDIIHREYRKKITLSGLARKSGLGSSRFSELFNEAFGVPPIVYINELRIKKATQLLYSSDMNITQISEYLGFSSVHYFSRMYKKLTGNRPSDIPLHKS